MEGFVVPRNLATAATLVKDVGPWLRGLPAEVATLADRFALDVGSPFEPGGYSSWVAPARTRAGTAVVLKVCFPHTEAAHEAEGLRAWDGRGTVRLIDSLRSDGSIALVLERCEPGLELGRLVAAPEQDEIVAALLRRLWIEPEPGHPFRPLAEMTREWAGQLDRDAYDRTFVDEAVHVFRELPSSAQRHVLLATDLHAQNVLSARREPWLVIDPKPYLGDPAYDPVQHLLNRLERVADDPSGVTARVAALCEVDVERLRLWLFARCAQEAALGRIPSWVEHARTVARHLAP